MIPILQLLKKHLGQNVDPSLISTTETSEITHYL